MPQQLPSQQLPHQHQQQEHQMQQLNLAPISQPSVEENKSNTVPEQTNEANAPHVAEAELISFD